MLVVDRFNKGSIFKIGVDMEWMYSDTHLERARSLGVLGTMSMTDA